MPTGTIEQMWKDYTVEAVRDVVEQHGVFDGKTDCREAYSTILDRLRSKGYARDPAFKYSTFALYVDAACEERELNSGTAYISHRKANHGKILAATPLPLGKNSARRFRPTEEPIHSVPITSSKLTQLLGKEFKPVHRRIRRAI